MRGAHAHFSANGPEVMKGNELYPQERGSELWKSVQLA
jgi:hypothetical protein